MMKKSYYLWTMIALLSIGRTAMANVNDPNDYTFLKELTSLQGSTTGWQNISYSGSQVGTTEFLMVSFSHGNPSCSQMNHIYKHKVQGGDWTKAVTAGNDDKSMEIWIREVTSSNRTNQGQIDTGGAGAVHAGITVYDGLAQVTNTAKVTQCNTTTIAINNNGSGPFLVVAASDNGTSESNEAMFHFSPGDDRVFVYLTTDQNFSDNTTGSLRGAIASLSLQDAGPTGTNDASFVSQNQIPTTLAPGQVAEVKVRMKNTGTTTWTNSSEHKLGSQNPQGNSTWGSNRAMLPSAGSVSPNQEHTFTFSITAPSTTGSYQFQWKMVQEFVEWFGALSPNKTITVSGTPVLVDGCDNLTGWNSSVTLNSADKQHGSGALERTTSSTPEFSKVFSTAYNSGLTSTNARLQFWYYVSDVSRFGSSNQVELGSGGAQDVNEYNWNLSGLQNGWNFISLDVSAAGVTGGTPNLNAINWFRIYHDKTGTITTRLDAIQLIDNGAVATTYAPLDDCDAKTGWSSSASLNTSDFQEGSGSLEFNGSDTPEFSKAFSTSYNSGVSEAEGVLSFWYYISDASKMSGTNQVELGSGGTNDIDEYNWELPALSNGWNLVRLNLSDANQLGTPNLNAIDWFRIYSFKSGSVVTRIDEIEVVDRDELYLDKCEAATGWSSANTIALSTTAQQGQGSVEMTGASTNEFQKVFSPTYNAGLTPSNARLEFWYYVSDPSQMSTTNNQVELGSGGVADVNEYHWNLSSFTAGWNLISLDVSAAGTTGGTPDLNAINWFRIYNSKSGSVTNRIDAIRLYDKTNARVAEVGEELSDKQVLIYPNPTTDYIVIDAGGTDLTGARVSVYTVTGQLAGEYSYDGSTQWKLPLSDLKSGVHLLTVHIEGEEFTQRIVIK